MHLGPCITLYYAVERSIIAKPLNTGGLGMTGILLLIL